MKRLKTLLLMITMIPAIFLLTGCENDSMDNIEIIVTNYPNEYVVRNLYGEHATITSIYPDGVDINNYKISKKQKTEYSKKDLFVYNGLIEKERNLAVDLLEMNPDLKIIDTAYVLETDYSPEELWLNPSSLLMMSQNVRLSLVEYITSSPALAMVIEGEEAITTIRKLVGATNPLEADLGTIRGDFGMDTGRNIIHASDAPESAEREIALFFNEDEICDYQIVDNDLIYE